MCSYFVILASKENILGLRVAIFNELCYKVGRVFDVLGHEKNAKHFFTKKKAFS
jgi:hypothetical protein